MKAEPAAIGPGEKRLRACLDRLIAGNASPEERSAVQQAMLAGHIAFTAGERSVAIAGDATGSIIITGDQAQINLELPEDACERLRERIFPRPEGIPPPFPGLILVGRETAIVDTKGLLGIGGASSFPSHFVIVRGCAGVGKTTLTAALARDPDVAAAFPDGVLWTSLGQDPALVSILAAWGRALGRDDLLRLPTTDDAIQELAVLLRPRRMLLIADDVWEPAHAILFQQVCGPQSGLIVTTREPSVTDVLARTENMVYNLPVLDDGDALKLLRMLAPTVVEEDCDACLKLVRDLDCLPLAIHVAGRLLRVESKFGWGVTRLLEEIRAGALLEAEAPADRAEGGKIPTVAALLKKSTDRLDARARDCFALLGAFAPKPAAFDLAAMQAIWQVDDPKPVARELVGRGLLEPAGAGRFQMHALLVQHARSLLTAS